MKLVGRVPELRLPQDWMDLECKRKVPMRPGRRSGTFERIYDVVRRIPKGRVATYGQIASLSGIAGDARLVGYALSALPEGHDVPWHRVINATGGISRRSSTEYVKIQRAMLEAEGVEFDARGNTSLARYQWKPRRR
jgi:methylated-DNA-protein-cysteine methyltransferase-like protein